MAKRKTSPSTVRMYVIDWRIEGSYEIAAHSPDEAQVLFDAKFKSGLPRFVGEGEVSNKKPYIDQ
jgi:hypothetical protein